MTRQGRIRDERLHSFVRIHFVQLISFSLKFGIELIGEAFPDYARQFNEDVSVNTLDVDDLEGWRILHVA